MTTMQGIKNTVLIDLGLTGPPVSKALSASSHAGQVAGKLTASHRIGAA